MVKKCFEHISGGCSKNMVDQNLSLPQHFSQQFYSTRPVTCHHDSGSFDLGESGMKSCMLKIAVELSHATIRSDFQI